jgi:hypothetical protein
VVEGQPVVTSGGGSETAFVFMDDGALLAVQRNELGDEMGWGSKICAAPADALADWTCAPDDRKYDSPLMFRYGERAYLIARRNVTDTGAYDLGFDDLDHTAQTLAYQLDYWQQPKRCALWEVHAGSLTVEHLLDLPSRGDTCFPGLIDHGGGDFTVYNYSSPVDGSDISWVEGQNGDTNIYRTPMRFRSE